MKTRWHQKPGLTGLLILLLLGIQEVHAQETLPSAEKWGQELVDLQQNGMMVLGAWALGNFAVSGYQMTRTSGSSYYFHQMNVFWNSVNAAIAVGGYLGASQLEMPMGSFDLYQEYSNFSKILLLNTGLDVAYVMTGLYLKERSNRGNKHQKRLKGYGHSLMLQGAFLLAFDLVLVLLNEHQMGQMAFSEDLQLALGPGGFRFAWQF